ncbi:MAG: thiamine pyrophosphate-binding protein [Nitrospinota bacterium]
MGSYADVVAAVLREAGIEYIFGNPGSLSSVELIEAGRKQGIRYILSHNESAAATMGATYGVLTGRPGVVSTAVGTGSTQVVNGVANAYLERAPLLVLTDRYSDEQFRRLRRQRVDQDRILQPITKASFKLAPGAVLTTMRRAVDIALEGRPGPVHVDLPYDVMLAEAPPEAFPGGAPVRRFQAGGSPEEPGLRAVAEAIGKAQRPLLIVGLQVNRAGAGAEAALCALAEALGAPVFATLAAKGTFPEDHPLAMGTFRGAGGESELIGKADLLVTVGFDAVELFAPGHWHYSQPVVNLDAVPHLKGVFRPAVELVGELEGMLGSLAKAVSPCGGWEERDLAAYRRAREARLRPVGEGLMPAAAIRILRDRLPSDGFLTADAGSHKVLASDLWECRRPRGFLTSSGLGTMGVAIPCAIATKLLYPDKPVVSLTGDGGLLMRMGELEVATREGLPFVCLVFNDGWLNSIKLKQDSRGFSRMGSRIGEVDFSGAARAFGFRAARVESEGELEGALAEAIASGEGWVIDAHINPDGYLAQRDVRPP